MNKTEKFELLSKLYDPHVNIVWRNRAEPFAVSTYLLKPGAGGVIYKMFPGLTGIALSQAALNVSNWITSTIENEAGITETLDEFRRECIVELKDAFPEGTIPTAKDIYDYSSKLTQKLIARGFMPSQETVNAVIQRLLDDDVI